MWVDVCVCVCGWVGVCVCVCVEMWGCEWRGGGGGGGGRRGGMCLSCMHFCVVYVVTCLCVMRPSEILTEDEAH